jgi:hypothetical protein
VLAAGDGAVLSHRSAAALWGIRPTAAPRIDVTVPRTCGFRSTPAIVVDFGWRDARLIVETDGHPHHGTREAFERDRARDARLIAAGWRVVRFAERQVRHEAGGVAELLRILLGLDSPASGRSPLLVTPG